MLRRLILASSNPAKQALLRGAFDGLGLDLTAPAGSFAQPSVAEGGPTFLDNARTKAVAWSAAAGCAAVSTDGGLIIPGLGDAWDPLRTGRFAGDEAGDLDRIEGLLRLMAPLEGDEREAWWTEALVIADGGTVMGEWQVESPHGLIATAYDPDLVRAGAWGFSLWRVAQFGKAHAELSADELARLDDHWSRLGRLVRDFAAGGGLG